MTTLRPYQRAALEAVYHYWDTEGGSPLLELATGTGKSVVIATLIRELLTAYPGMRVLCLVHVRELVQQNADALLRAWPGAPVGINSAGLGRRDTQHPILFASIQSVHKAAARIGRRDLVLVDEAHLLPAHGEGMYHSLLNEMQFTTSPDLRLFGCTATPYRLDSGRLDRGKGRLFDRICFSYGIGEGVRDGFLSPLVAKGMHTEIDVDGVAKRGGEFVPSALGVVADQDSVTRAAVAEIAMHGAQRKSWLLFASSVDHAFHLRDEVRRHGVSCETVTGETPKGERAAILKAFKTGQIRAITNMSVLTTGFDAPAVDLIAMLRPTLSTGLYVQMLGRGTRLAPGKQDCLVLDFSGNVRRHGPVDEIEIEEKKTTSERPAAAVSDVRSKACPNCLTYNAVATAVCVTCGFVLREPEKHDAVADTAPVMSGRGPHDWREVHDVAYTRHTKMGGGTPTLRVEYFCGRKTYSEFICFDHPPGSFPRKKAERWWIDRGGDSLQPAGVVEALNRSEELAPVGEIRVAKEGDYWRVLSVRDRAKVIA